MSEFLSYRETRQLLADKFNATQESMAYEIAAWVGLRSLLAYQNSEELGDDGLVVGDRDRFFFDDKGRETQSFDYFPKLERCYFKRADVEGFEPQDRYINGVALVQRWAAVCSGEDGARAKIRSCCPQSLTDYFPGYGGTQASVNQCDYALWPPLDMALFSLRQVSAIEGEGFGDDAIFQPVGENPIAAPILESNPEGEFMNESLSNEVPTDSQQKKPVINTVSLLAQVIAAKKGVKSEEAMEELKLWEYKSYPPKSHFINPKGHESFKSGQSEINGDEYSRDDFRAFLKNYGITIKQLESMFPDYDFFGYFGSETYKAMWEAVTWDVEKIIDALKTANIPIEPKNLPERILAILEMLEELGIDRFNVKDKTKLNILDKLRQKHNDLKFSESTLETAWQIASKAKLLASVDKPKSNHQGNWQ